MTKEGMKNRELMVKDWMARSRDDLRSAKVMLDGGRWTWCAFICQQALEKCLKAGYVQRKNEIPPYTHKLERLCELLKLDPPEELLKAIISIDKYYIAARYPVYKEKMNVKSSQTAKGIFADTRKAHRWFVQELDI